MDEIAPPFLPAEDLIERSQPAPRTGWAWYGLSGFAAVVMLGALSAQSGAAAKAAMELLGGLLLIGVFGAMGMMSWFALQRQRAEQRRLEAVEELVQLRRWSEAAIVLQQLLSRPTRTPGARVQGLIYLSGVLARFQRYADAIAVQEYLLANVEADPGTVYSLKLGRAMAMLHEDRLVDADRAISELRRTEGSGESAGLALLEMYRDVKTGHPNEAIELFGRKRPLMQKQLGQRLADGYALLAKAYDMVGREAEARQAYADATVLAPIAEVGRRYPEVASLGARYPATAAPGE